MLHLFRLLLFAIALLNVRIYMAFVYVCLCSLFFFLFNVWLLRTLSSGENGCFLLNRKPIWAKNLCESVRAFYTCCVCNEMFTGPGYGFRLSFILSFLFLFFIPTPHVLSRFFCFTYYRFFEFSVNFQ